MARKVTVTENFSKAFSGQPIETEFGIPVSPSAAVAPISLNFDLQEKPELDTKAIEASYEAKVKALESQLVAELTNALTVALKSSVWSWKGGPRDIYDTGKLAASANISMSSGSLVVKYDAPYAGIVHNGGYIFPYGNKSARPIYLPPRPWIDSVLYGGGPVPRFDFGEFFKRNL